VDVDPSARFAALVDADGEVPLDEACLLIAANAHPGLDVEAQLARLDALAAGVAAPTLAALTAHLFGEVGLAGDRITYHDARNSLLPDVLDRRLGIPITLAVVAMEVGRRCGVPLLGIGMPGHFLVRPAEDPLRFVDVFDGGTPLDVAGCRRVFESLHPGAAWDDGFLRPAASRLILIRILANLAGAHRRAGDRRGLCWALGLRMHLPGVTDAERRELAVLLGASGRFVEAAEALEHVGEERDLEAATKLRARLN
jgi:regulator of sirC expression with transglutaminase-like and TPR domain